MLLALSWFPMIHQNPHTCKRIRRPAVEDKKTQRFESKDAFILVVVICGDINRLLLGSHNNYYIRNSSKPQALVELGILED